MSADRPLLDMRGMRIRKYPHQSSLKLCTIPFAGQQSSVCVSHTKELGMV